MTGTLNLIRYIITGVNKPPNKKKTKTNCFTYTRWKKNIKPYTVAAGNKACITKTYFEATQQYKVQTNR